MEQSKTNSKSKRKTKTKTKRNTKTKSNSVYTRKHFKSNDGMLTSVWGPSTWHLLHTMSFNYPVEPSCEDKRHYREFVCNLQYVLPCGKCRKNLRKNFKKLPLMWKHMDSRQTFSKYIYNLHEVINTMLKKKSGLTYDDVRERYEHFRARCALPVNGEKDSNPAPEVIKEKEKEKEKEPTLTIPAVLDEKGCTEPIYGEKSKCVLKIVPQSKKVDTFQIDEKCIKRLTPIKDK